MTCKNLGNIHAKGADHPDVHHCAVKKYCTLIRSSMRLRDGSPMPFCHDECDGFVGVPVLAAAPRSRSRLAYFTGSNRQGERQMIESMIRSARAAGVPEDIHVFHAEDCEGAVNHRISRSFDWKNHMGKLDLLLMMEGVDAEYVCWLDTDTWFVRDPGDLSELIRNNPCWILMEGEVEKSVHGDWWEIRHDTKPSLIDIMRSYRPSGTLWTTNGGFWIVRRDFIREFHNLVFGVWNNLRSIGYPRMSDEPPLAIVGQTAVPDPENNTFEKCKHIWAIEWNGAWRDRGKLPDGTAWEYKDWTTQAVCGNVNPAICHLMRAKHLMIPGKEPVGTKLALIIAECGIAQSPNCSCKAMQRQMDQWGIGGCRMNRQAILDHLNSQSSGLSWGDVLKVAAKGYLTPAAMLDEAVKRCAV